MRQGSLTRICSRLFLFILCGYISNVQWVRGSSLYTYQWSSTHVLELKKMNFPGGFILQRCWAAPDVLCLWEAPCFLPLLSTCSKSLQTLQQASLPPLWAALLDFLALPRCPSHPHSTGLGLLHFILEIRVERVSGLQSTLGIKWFVGGHSGRERLTPSWKPPKSQFCPLSQADLTIYSSRIHHVFFSWI